MVDLNTCPPTPPVGESSKIKNFMGRTPGLLKSKFLTVLGNSNELLNGISNKLTLSISSSDSDYCDDGDEDLPQFDETIDYTKIDFEARRVKARRAHEEVISGRYRHPNWAPKTRLDATGATIVAKALSSSSSSARSSSAGSCSAKVSSRSNSIDSRPSTGIGGRAGRAVAGARRSDIDIANDMKKINDLLNAGAPVIDVEPPSDVEGAQWQTKHQQQHDVMHRLGLETATGSANSILVPSRSKTSNSSTLTSLHDDPAAMPSPSVESTDWKNWNCSESENSLPSWASSISLDCRPGDEPVKEFMKQFTEILFTNAPTIGLELKSEFGQMARLETGRQWFSRFVLAQKLKSNKVDEITFYSMVQFFAIVLFECSECEDFGPATMIMNVCFDFYHEIEVPGCEPYREYLFTYLRQQPIWHTLRFWNAAFFDAVHTERERRLAAKKKRESRHKQKLKGQEQIEATGGGEDDNGTAAAPTTEPVIDIPDDNESSSSSSSHDSNAVVAKSTSGKSNHTLTDDQRFQQSITFKQLGTFTCNMHSLGIRKELCLDFLKKQSASVSLQKDKVKLVKDNIHRMYHETDLWGAKQT